MVNLRLRTARSVLSDSLECKISLENSGGFGVSMFSRGVHTRTVAEVQHPLCFISLVDFRNRLSGKTGTQHS